MRRFKGEKINSMIKEITQASGRKLNREMWYQSENGEYKPEMKLGIFKEIT